MKRKHSFKLIIAMTMVVSLMMSSCSALKKSKKKDFYGNPDKNTRFACGMMYPKGLSDPWVEDMMLECRYEGVYQARKGDTVLFNCSLRKDLAERVASAELNLQKSILTMYIFKSNEEYAWSKDEAVLSRSGEVSGGRVYDSNGELADWVGYDFSFTLPDDISIGTYTIVLVRDDDTVDSMIEFKVVYELPKIIPETTAEKPVIYLYPEEKTDVHVGLDFIGRLTCTYPEYGTGWDVTAYPDGRLFDKNSSRYYDYLFWEGKMTADTDLFRKAACVASEDTAGFLETYLAASGLNDSEIDDFISYWLPKLQSSPYNLISFPNEEYARWAKLDVSPAPDTEIRVFMVFRPLDQEMEIPEGSALEMPSGVERKGFTLVEWGGMMPAE